MQRQRTKFFVGRGAAAITLALLIAGCSGWESMDYQPTSEIPEGPGLISGKKGKWTIFRIEDQRDEEEGKAAKEEDERKKTSEAE